MRTATLDDFMALNDQLAALLQAGVPVDVGLPRRQEVTAQLQQINSSVARRVSQGLSLESALDNDEQATPAYRGLVLVGLQSGNLSEALQRQTELSQSIDDTSRELSRGLIYPLIVAFLAYVALVCLCLYFVPQLDSLYRSLHLRSGWGLDLLQALRGSLPVWVAIPPSLVLIALAWRWSRRSRTRGASTARSWSWLPEMSQTIHWQRCAAFADSLASLLENGAPWEQALATSAAIADDASLQRGTTELLAASRLVSTGIGHTRAAFPPFLRWAVLQSESTTGRPAALRMAARWYREAARRHSDRIRVVVPLVACVVIGGGAVLLYGLAVFAPVLELFRMLAI